MKNLIRNLLVIQKEFVELEIEIEDEMFRKVFILENIVLKKACVKGEALY